MRVIIFICSLFLFTNLVFASPWQRGQYEGKSFGNKVLGTIGSSEGIKRYFSNPLTSSSSKMRYLTGALYLCPVTGSKYSSLSSCQQHCSKKCKKEDSFSAQITAPSSKNFLSIFIKPGSTGDLEVIIKEDRNLDNKYDYYYTVPFKVSGVCANGVISCDPGTWKNCLFYKWTAKDKKVSLLAVDSIDELGGCYCINNSCGDLALNNSHKILTDLGGGIVGAIQDQDPNFTITSIKTNKDSIVYYGQESIKAGYSLNSGSAVSGSTNPQKYYSNPSKLDSDVRSEVIKQSNNPDSYYSELTSSPVVNQQKLSIQSCIIKHDIYLVSKKISGSGCKVPKCTDIPVESGDIYHTCRFIPNIFYFHTQGAEYRSRHNCRDGPCNGQCPKNSQLVSVVPDCAVPIGWQRKYTHNYCKKKHGKDKASYRNWTFYKQDKSFIRVDYLILSKTDTCISLEKNENCKLKEEEICDSKGDCIKTWKNFVPIKAPATSCKKFIGNIDSYLVCLNGSYISIKDSKGKHIVLTGKNIWWKVKRIYDCTSNTKFNLTAIKKRFSHIGSTTKSNSSIYYEDYNPYTGKVSPQSASLEKIDSNSSCEKACKLRKVVIDTSANKAGNKAQYQLNTKSYEYIYRRCVNNKCPVEPGETVVENCQCLNEFKEAATYMQILDDASHDITCTSSTNKDGECLGKIYIFNGHGDSCRTPSVETGWFNCCNGGSIWFGLSKCNKKEIKLSKAIEKGLCHYVGEYCAKEVLGKCIQKKKTYCCFNSKLGRIIAEQGRIQLKSFGPDGGWGDPEDPNCRGFTPEEFEMLDFSKMDLSGWYKDIKAKSTHKIQENMKNKIGNFYKEESNQ